MKQLLDAKLNAYAEAHTESESSVLRALNRETHAKHSAPQMLAGHLQGWVLRTLAHMIRPRRVLEIGTYTGYSAICFASGLRPGGRIDTIERNPKLAPTIRRYLSRAKVDRKVRLHFGNALEIIPTIRGTFDLVYIDADKENYARYYDLVFDHVHPGGFILADNVLWSGRVVLQAARQDAETRAIVRFNKKVLKDKRVESGILPIRDGLLIARKKTAKP
jgi:caffeoyl-CoA O-methyltransferase